MSKKLLIFAFALSPALGRAQAPTLASSAPARHASSVPRTEAVAITFSQPVTGAADLSLTGAARGLRSGSPSGDGTATLRLQPARAWLPGEEASLTVPATVRGAAGGNQNLASGQVVQFRAAAGPGTGTFTVGQRLGTNSSGIKDPVMADVNNDGNLDLMCADDQIANALLLYPGTGQGGFGAQVRIQAGGPAPISLAVADFNRDGNVDLVNTGFMGVNNGNGTAVSLGNGQGSFTRSALMPTSTADIAPRVGDINADGNPDLLYVELAPISPTGPTGLPYAADLVVRLGDGLGNFTALPKIALPAGQAIYVVGSMHLADLNQDGRLDLLYCASGSTQLLPYLGNGQGSFVASPTLAAANGPAVALAELTGDGILDAVTADTRAGSVRVYPGTGQGGFAASAAATFATVGTTAAQASDADGDGDLDLFIAEIGTPGATPYRNVRLWLNNGFGTFAAGTTLPMGTSPGGTAGALAVGDLNNDGALDVAVVENYGDTMGPFIGIRLNTALAAAPTLAGFTPSTGQAGTVVTLTGTNFTGATGVLLGGVSLPGFVVNSGTSITVTLPAGVASGRFAVITPTGQATSASAFQLPLTTRASIGAFASALFPNPAHGAVQLQATGLVRAAVLNSLGQQVAAWPAREMRMDSPVFLDISSLSPGLYTMRLSNGAATIMRQLLVE